MAWFPDLEPLAYFGEDAARVLRAVGWLDRGHPFARGPADRATFDKLVELSRDPYQPFALAGSHHCNICQFVPERTASANLFVPGPGFLFACPVLITHYINSHEYRPPSEFCAAVLACDDTRSMQYKRAFLENGGRLLLRAG